MSLLLAWGRKTAGLLHGVGVRSCTDPAGSIQDLYRRRLAAVRRLACGRPPNTPAPQNTRRSMCGSGRSTGCSPGRRAPVRTAVWAQASLRDVPGTMNDRVSLAWTDRNSPDTAGRVQEGGAGGQRESWRLAARSRVSGLIGSFQFGEGARGAGFLRVTATGARVAGGAQAAPAPHQATAAIIHLVPLCDHATDPWQRSHQ